MNKNKFFYGVLLMALVLGPVACKDQLQVGNPNSPTLSGNVNDEAGLIALAEGSVYLGGFQQGDGWLGDSYFSLPWGYIELMADVVGADAANNQVSVISLPDDITLDNSTNVTNPAHQIQNIRTNNNRAATGANLNVLYYQWLNMYAMNSGMNVALSRLGGITLGGDATTRANTIKAWCYFWKGYAYGSIGTMYYAGLITDQATGANSAVNSNYVLHDAMIYRSNYYYKQAMTLFQGITNMADYQIEMSQLIPAQNQVGLGGSVGAVLTPAQFIQTINTLLARNIILSKLSPFVNGNLNSTITKSSTTNMTPADWDSVLTYANAGITTPSTLVITGRSTAANSFFTATGGTVPSLAARPNLVSTFTVQERVLQYFGAGDHRVTNNFDSSTQYNNNYTFTTRWSLVDGGNSMPGVYTYANRTAGEYELFIAGSYEENALMLAEANIRLGNTEAGLAFIDAVRTNMGAGVPAVAGTGLTPTQAMTQLVSERRVALLFRGVSFYDYRRWGWIYKITNGGGAYGQTVFYSNQLNTNAIFDYDFLDYWDVPADESALNPSTSSVATQNPNF